MGSMFWDCLLVMTGEVSMGGQTFLAAEASSTAKQGLLLLTVSAWPLRCCTLRCSCSMNARCRCALSCARCAFCALSSDSPPAHAAQPCVKILKPLIRPHFRLLYDNAVEDVRQMPYGEPIKPGRLPVAAKHGTKEMNGCSVALQTSACLADVSALL